MMEEVLKDPRAQEDSLPPYIPGLLRPPLRFMARMGVRYIQQEFNTAVKSPMVYSSQMVQALIGLDTALERAGGLYLIGDRFTLADILGVLAVGGVLPSERMRAQMGPALSRASTQEHLVERFGRLIEWRDRMVREHR
jgi:glutathione S-transferase